MTDLRKKFDDFVIECKLVEYAVNKSGVTCIMEPDFYEDYNWFCVAFMTDKFGGIAAIIKYYDNKWFINEKEVPSSLDALTQVPELMKDLYDKRDMEGLADFINSQYD